MRPLRPHNWYGGTTCPGRVTGQVPTIRGLIPEEDDMTDAEFLEAFERLTASGKIQDVMKDMRFHAYDDDGKQLAAVATLVEWFGVIDEHRKDDAKHGGGGEGVSEARARAIAQEEDGKLKVTK